MHVAAIDLRAGRLAKVKDTAHKFKTKLSSAGTGALPKAS
jgi:hypothetical protein